MIYLFLLPFYILLLFEGFKEPVTPVNLKEWVSFLSSDQMKGRLNGSSEMKLAAYWIAGKFNEMGLKPLKNSEGFIQNFIYSSRQSIINERNVLGYFEGSDPVLKSEFIILSAHFDHIGILKGNHADSICNGADDNAAGTATLIGIAKTIMNSELRPGRSIIFAAFSGEEHGMKGSRYFVANLPDELKNIYSNLNFEMTGHSEYLGKRKYYMTGCHYSNLDNLIGEYNKNTGFKLIDTIPLSDVLFNSSDNIAFSRISVRDEKIVGIPSGTFATTAFAGYIHNPYDEAELFDFDNMSELIKHFSEVVIWLSNNKDEIKWTNPKFVRP